MGDAQRTALIVSNLSETSSSSLSSRTTASALADQRCEPSIEPETNEISVQTSLSNYSSKCPHCGARNDLSDQKASSEEEMHEPSTFVVENSAMSDDSVENSRTTCGMQTDSVIQADSDYMLDESSSGLAQDLVDKNSKDAFKDVSYNFPFSPVVLFQN